MSAPTSTFGEPSGPLHALRVTYQDLETLAVATAGMSSAVLDLAGATGAVAVDGNLVLSAILNPGGFAQIEGRCTAAVLGPQGMAAFVLVLTAESIGLRAAVVLYRAVDVMVDVTVTTFDFGWHLGQFLATGDGDWEEFLTEHPGVIDGVVAVASVVLGGGLAATLNPALIPYLLHGGGPKGGAAVVALLYPYEDGVPHVNGPFTPDRSSQDRFGSGKALPNFLSGIVDRSNDMGDNAEHPERQGQISIRKVTGADGATRYIVDIPGTQDWHINPLGGDMNYLNDLGTNLKALSGQRTEYEAGIAEAMRRAGVPAGAEVMLVGHSQGGIVAMNAAQASGTSRFPFNVTHVLTAGSPVGLIDVPDRIHVLSLENANDIVPHLDNATNPHGPTRNTAVFTNPTGTVGGNHAVEGNYLQASAQLESRPEAADFISSSKGFVASEAKTETEVYQITRWADGDPNLPPASYSGSW